MKRKRNAQIASILGALTHDKSGSTANDRRSPIEIHASTIHTININVLGDFRSDNKKRAMPG